MMQLGLVSVAQFTQIPRRPEGDQRDVILNVMFLRYSGAGILARDNHNLDDYGISPALASVAGQTRAWGDPREGPAVEFRGSKRRRICTLGRTRD